MFRVVKVPAKKTEKDLSRGLKPKGLGLVTFIATLSSLNLRRKLMGKSLILLQSSHIHTLQLIVLNFQLLLYLFSIYGL